MWDDGSAVQGRQTKRKWNIVGLLLAAALLSSGGAWLTAHPGMIQRQAGRLLSELVPGGSGEWLTPESCGQVLGAAGNAVLCAGDGAILAISPKGTALWKAEPGWTAPLVRSGMGYAAVYEPGGTSVLLAGESGFRILSTPQGADLAAAGPQGQAAVVTAGSGYLTVTELFSPEGVLTDSICLQDRAMVLMDYLPDGTLAACCVDRTGNWTLLLEGTELPLETAAVYDLRSCGGDIALWTAEGMSLYDRQGLLLSQLPLDGAEILCWDCGDFLAAGVLEDSAWRLRTLNRRGVSRTSEPLPGKPECLTVCDKSVCVLDSSDLLVYDVHGILRMRIDPGGGAERLYPVPGGLLLTGGGQYQIHALSS